MFIEHLERFAAFVVRWFFYIRYPNKTGDEHEWT